MPLKGFGIAGLVALVAVTASGRTDALGKPGLTAAPCPNQKWEPGDPAFQALPGAKASFGRYDGGVYRLEVPDAWNGELVLWAHGYVANAGANGSRLRVGFPGAGQGSPMRTHLVRSGFAWAASSYGCNGYVPGRGLLDTLALVDVVAKQSGKPPSRVYLSGASMGGHVTVLGLQEFPTSFAGGLAMCPAGPGEMDFLTSVAAASELISGVKVEAATREQDAARLTEILGKPPAYTAKGRQLASIQILLSGGPRPFAVEGLASRFLENATTFSAGETIWDRVATNSDVRYAIEDGLDLTAEAINTRVRRKAADREARSERGPYEEAIPFDGKLERPLMTIHNTGDLYVPVSLEQSLKRSVDAAGRSPLLVQRLVRSAGHCTFSPQEQVAAFDDLVKWVRQGVRPEGDEVLGDLTNAGLKFTQPLRPGDPGSRRIAEGSRR
jgi:pimeloyl-ACP methyl ester carboxylesterase